MEMILWIPLSGIDMQVLVNSHRLTNLTFKIGPKNMNLDFTIGLLNQPKKINSYAEQVFLLEGSNWASTFVTEPSTALEILDPFLKRGPSPLPYEQFRAERSHW